jgi:hypothetical protein
MASYILEEKFQIDPISLDKSGIGAVFKAPRPDVNKPDKNPLKVS